VPTFATIAGSGNQTGRRNLAKTAVPQRNAFFLRALFSKVAVDLAASNYQKLLLGNGRGEFDAFSIYHVKDDEGNMAAQQPMG
jgi:hypothetical protein